MNDADSPSLRSDRRLVPATNVDARHATLAVWIAACVACLIAIVVTGLPREALLASVPVPDGVEYAAGAQRLATSGRFDLPIGGQLLPSRYPPSFACLLTPAYWLSPDDFFAGRWACRLIWGAGCGALAFGLARRLGASASLLVVTALTLHPIVRATASTLLSDAPGLASLFILLAIRMIWPAPRLRAYAAAGVALALGVACRSFAIAFALPFVPLLFSRRRGRITSACALLGPAAAVLAANATYNRVRFGSLDMNGYVFWCAMPYSRFDYIFHPSYLPAQIGALVADPWFTYPAIGGVAGAVVLRRWARPLWRDVVVPALLATVPLSTLYSFYFFKEERLFLPLIAASSLPALIVVALLVARSVRGQWLAGITIVTLVCYASLTPRVSAEAVAVDQLVTQLHDRLPQRCRLLTILDPLTVEGCVTHGTEREWIPVGRSQEYADKLISNRRLDLTGIPRPPPLQHLDGHLIAQGARPAIAETGEDDALLDRLTAPSALPLFVDLATLNESPALRQRLARRFSARPVAGASMVFECVPKVASTRPTLSP